MGEKKGFITVLFLVGVFMVPFMLDIWISNIKSDKFMKVTTEFHQLVEEEGGNSAKVKAITSGLASKGLHVTLSPSTDKPPVGTPITISYTHNYKGVYRGMEKKLVTTNKVTVSKRNN